MIAALQTMPLQAGGRSPALPIRAAATATGALPSRWGVTASAALHMIVVLAAGALVLHRGAAQDPEPAFALILHPPPASDATISSARLEGPRQQPLFDALPPTLPAISTAPAVGPMRQRQPQAVAGHRRTSLQAKSDTDPGRPGTVPGGSSHAAAPDAKSPPDPSQAASGAISLDLLARLEAEIQLAVQQATAYPQSARMMRRGGQAQVGFAFSDGAVSRITLVVSSGMRVLDGAAMAAVQRARMPRAPAGLGGRTVPLQVWVRFSLTSNG